MVYLSFAVLIFFFHQQFIYYLFITYFKWELMHKCTAKIGAQCISGVFKKKTMQ